MHLFLFLLFITKAEAEDIYTAMVRLNDLLETEKTFVSLIADYVDFHSSRLQIIKTYLMNLAKLCDLIASTEGEQVKNPLSAFLLVKRLTSDWKSVETLITDGASERHIRNFTSRLSQIKTQPHEEDLKGAIQALIRLQDTYNLNTHDLASGLILGRATGYQLTGHDCFEIGRAAYLQNDFYHTVLWMQEAEKLLENENPITVELRDVMDYLAYALYKQGNVERALQVTKRLAGIDSANARIADNEKILEGLITSDNALKDKLPPIRLERFSSRMPEREKYEALCRGQQWEDETEWKLYCFYKNDRPFLRLAPIKTEILHISPTVVLFRNVISDYEIAILRNLATPKLQRATVQNMKTGESEHVPYRISKSSWFKEEEHPVIKVINKRIDLMTNLKQRTSEDLQVANYGIGGYYDLHYDMSTRGEANPYNLGVGNRIATVLFYMTDVEAGGATVFTEFGKSVFPSKHDALFWYNLNRDGSLDMRTRHAACPVLMGSKWVANKWIHEYGQEFRRPCISDEILRSDISEIC